MYVADLLAIFANKVEVLQGKDMMRVLSTLRLYDQQFVS